MNINKETNKKINKKKRTKELFQIIVNIKSLNECIEFFNDLCTPQEINSFSERWEAAQLINKGLSYREINKICNISTATITRVARSLKYGNGYKKILKDPNKKNEKNNQIKTKAVKIKK